MQPDLFGPLLHLAGPPPQPAPYRVPLYRVHLVRERAVTAPYGRLASSRCLAAIGWELLHDVDREHMLCLMLDVKNQVTGVHVVAVGSLTAAVVHPREMFKAAILHNAAAIALLHNHPSGNPYPSQEDRVLTTRIQEGGKLLGITVLDHVVLGDGPDVYWSFADEGLL